MAERVKKAPRREADAERCSFIIRTIPDIVYELDVDGNFVFVNGAIAQLGYAPRELMGRHFKEIVHPDDAGEMCRQIVLPKYVGRVTGSAAAPKLFDERRTGLRRTRNLEIRLRVREKGDAPARYCWAEIHAHGKWGRSAGSGPRRFLGSIGIARNIDDRKMAERELLHAQKVEAIGTLTGGIAHDFNNLLAGIMGYTSLMRLAVKKGSAIESDLDAIEKLAQRGASLTGKLLSFSRKGGYQPTLVDINRLVTDALGVLEHTAGKGIDIVAKLSSGVPWVFGDEGEIHQVVMNICLNACEAMPEGGSLTVRTDEASPGEEFRRKHPRLAKGRLVSVTVADTGCGMAAETAARIFEPFFTTKVEKAGTGLGLAVVRIIMEKQGGCVTLETHPGKGSVFTAYFPAGDKAEAETHPRTNEEWRGNEAILVVDDEMDFREGLARWLRKMGYTVLTSACGEDAVQVVESRPGGVGLVILDMVMKGMGGAATFRRMRKFSPDLPIIICTGYCPDAELRRMIERDASALVEKPFEFRELGPKLRMVLDGRRVR